MSVIARVGKAAGAEVLRGARPARGGAFLAYVTGTTSSPDYPTTTGAFDTTFNGGERDAFVTKLPTD